jgi:flavodoxin/ferredoxin
MPKSLIIYFSQNNTTFRVAENIAEGLRRAGYTTDMCNVKDESCPDLCDYDLVGLGAPVYYFRPPFNIQQFVRELPNLNKQRFFVFLLYANYPWNTYEFVKSALLRKGADIVGYFQCRGASHYLGYIKLGYQFSLNHPTVEELAQAEEFGFKVGNHQPFFVDYLHSPIIYRIERLLTSEWLAQSIYSKLFKVDKQKCHKCGLCMKVCPTKNIIKGKNDFPIWRRNCLLCAMCEAKCPNGAIKSPMTGLLFRPFQLYNVISAAQDPALKYVKVTHKNGQTKTVGE